MKNTNIKEKREIVTRLNVTKGHVAAIVHMIEEDKDCDEILMQLDAIRASLLKISTFVAQHYAKTCMLDALNNGQPLEENFNKSIEILMKINQYYLVQQDISFSDASKSAAYSK